MKLTIAYAKSKTGKGYFGIIKEIPGVASQASSLKELRKNLKDAVKALLSSY